MSLTQKLGKAHVSTVAWLFVLVLQMPFAQGQSKNDPNVGSSTADMIGLIARGEDLLLIDQLSNKADPNGRNNEGVSLLLTAWQTRQRRAFDILLEAGADLHQTLSRDVVLKVDEQELLLQSGSSVAFTAMQFSYWRPEFVELVLRYLKRPNQRNGRQETILHTLVSNHRIRLDKRPGSCVNNPIDYELADIAVILAVNAGVDINALDADRKTVLNFTVPREPISQEFLDRIKKFPLADAIEGEIRWSAMSLFNRGANPYIKSNEGSSFVDEIKNLAEKNLGFKDLRSFAENLEKKKHLLEGKPLRTEELPSIGSHISPQVFDDIKNNYICNSAQGGRGVPYLFDPIFLSSKWPIPVTRDFDEIVTIGFEPNSVGKGGFSFLLATLLVTNEDSFKKLIQMGASPDLRLTANLWDVGTSHSLRAEEEKARAREGYQFWPDKGDTVLMAACLNPFRRKQFVELALAATKEPNQRDELGRNLLHLLLYHPLLEGQEILVEKLIQAGVDVNARTVGGATPSHVAVGMNPGIIPTLVKAGADLQIRDLRERTVLDLLKLAISEEWGSSNECRRVLELIVLRKGD